MNNFKHLSAKLLPFIPLLSLALLASGCIIIFTNPKPPSREFEIGDLFLEITSFPEGWTVQGNGPYEACNASPLGSGCHAYGEYMRYQHSNGRENAKETIYRYRSPERASRDFSKFVEDEFVTWPDQQSWQVPPGISFENAEAENFYVACRAEAVGEECQLAAQYQEFVVVISILTESPNIDLLLSLFEEIDNRMASFLSS